MTESQLAAFIASHAVGLLLLVVVLLLGLTALLWLAIERWMPVVFARAAPLWQRLDARGYGARYLGLHAAGSFVLAATGLAVFLELADEIGADEELSSFDLALASALGRTVSLQTLRAFAYVTHLGDAWVLIAAGVLIALVLFVRREWLLAWSWTIATAGGGLLNSGLKLLFARPRPEFLHDVVAARGYSFPSGHAAGSMVFYGMLAYLIVRHSPRAWHVPSVVLAMLVIVFVGASRVLLQVHFLSDVLAGWAVAATWTALCVAGLEALRLGQWRRPRAPG
jgi:membrane-associated phospholipid phosphatase